MRFINYVEKLKLEARKKNILVVREEIDKAWVKTKINTFITAWDGMWSAEEVKEQILTNDIVAAIGELKKGRTEYRADKQGTVHIAVGKVSMEPAKVAENINTLISEVEKKAPNGNSVGFIQSISVSSTMGPGVWVDVKEGE